MKINENTGKVFQAIRKSKHMSMQELADDDISQSQISRFERGESNLTIDKFLVLLRNLSMSFDEFQQIYNRFALTEDEQFQEDLALAFENGNTTQLRSMLKDLDGQIARFPQKKFLQINQLVVKAVLAQLANFRLPKEDIETLKEYLMSVEDWGRFELWAFANSAQLYNDATLNLMAAAIIEKTEFYQNITQNKQVMLRILLNLIALWIQRENYRLALKYMTYLEKELNSVDFLYEKLMLRYNKGLYRYKNGDKSGLVMMRECNDMLQKLGIFKSDENAMDPINFEEAED